MNLRFDTGTIVTLLAVVFFYGRLVYIGRRNKQLQRKARPKPAKKNQVEISQAQKSIGTMFGYTVGNWVIGVIGFVVLLLGFLLAATTIIPPPIKDYWWIGTAAGIVILSFAFT